METNQFTAEITFISHYLKQKVCTSKQPLFIFNFPGPGHSVGTTGAEMVRLVQKLRRLFFFLLSFAAMYR